MMEVWHRSRDARCGVRVCVCYGVSCFEPCFWGAVKSKTGKNLLITCFSGEQTASLENRRMGVCDSRFMFDICVCVSERDKREVEWVCEVVLLSVCKLKDKCVLTLCVEMYVRVFIYSPSYMFRKSFIYNVSVCYRCVWTSSPEV